MHVRALFFASLKDIVGSRELAMDVPEGTTISDLLTQLEGRYPRFTDYRSVILTAINEEYADKTAQISDGDEIAIFPPVSGGLQ
jgi:molybdopterin synthase catalytic subunit